MTSFQISAPGIRCSVDNINFHYLFIYLFTLTQSTVACLWFILIYIPIYTNIYIYQHRLINLYNLHVCIYIIQIYSGITFGRVLNGELYTCKLYKLINLCWSTGCFVKLHFTSRDDFIEGFSTVNIQNLAGLCC